MNGGDQHERLETLLTEGLAGTGPVLWLTGAGISAESGIPTFRGKEGYYQVGSRHYHPMELATYAAFRANPEHVWSWYLYRRSVCLGAAPNGAHRALASLEDALGHRFLLITQNVDGLHTRAGNSRERTYAIHGDIELMRFEDGAPFAIPQAIPSEWEKDRLITPEEADLLKDGRGALGRPHVLWFDETYDEENFRWESSLAAAERAAMLIVVGTTGATNLPRIVADVAARRGVPIIVINPEPSPFSAIALSQPRGLYIEGTAGDWVPHLAARMAERASDLR